jgi:hypothetical protein
MTPQQKIKAKILQDCEIPCDESNVDETFDNAGDRVQDAIFELREGQVETKLDCDWSRHYESKSVAAKMLDGSWVGWTYWYGGGKHGEPESIPWMEEAYDLDCVEEEKMVVVRTFTKK